MLLLLFASKYPFVAIIVFGAINCVLATEQQNIHQKKLDKKENTEKGEWKTSFSLPPAWHPPQQQQWKYIHVVVYKVNCCFYCY